MRLSRFIIVLFLGFTTLQAQDLVNDTKAVQALLKQEKEKYKSNLLNPKQTYSALLRLLELGEWDYVVNQLQDNKGLSAVESAELWAKYHWLNNDFFAVEKALQHLKAADKSDLRIQRLFALLDIEAWELTKAEQLAKQLLEKYPNDIETSLILGRALLLQKKYPEALDLAHKMIAHDTKDASGYFLKADIFFWDQKPKEAEETLVQGLKLNPLHADSRFYYGYAIWRRIDATQLNDMVAQWELALGINPLHYQAHWHLGNGHTNLTFTDYVDDQEKAIRGELEEADELFTANKIAEAFQVIDRVEAKYPQSVLPAMHRGSLLYGDFDAMDRKERLDKAEQVFLSILQKKKHYGPAHNGLSAVLKSKRIPFLSTYEEKMKAYRNPKIDNMQDFLQVFPDVAYYPGNVAKGMAWNQLYTAVVYFPFLVKQHRDFVIPPLHEDLAIAMKAPYFRFNTTFDNRQWMDIRGVGSGAASIEYTERGAFEERNVLLHEYVHLFHGRVLTDEQNRKIKALYYNAMVNGLTLDYYSQNNESEYLAQTYPAYFEEVKVHPLDFKSMNTTADLKTKDPEMYAFLHDMITKEKAYLAGDKQAMASNWSQVYVNLASEASKNDLTSAYLLLDTALQYDSKYLPAHLAYARYQISEHKFDLAKERLNLAKGINTQYAPIYAVEASLIVASEPADIQKQAALYQKAYELETDYMEKAQNANMLRNFYFQRGMLKEALEVALEYWKNGSEISTYLRDRKDDNVAFYAWQKALLGDSSPIKDLAYLVSQKPQNYNLRRQYAEVFLANGQYTEALENLMPVYRNLQASQVSRPEFELLLAETYAGLGNLAERDAFLAKLTAAEADVVRLEPLYNLRLVRLLYKAGKATEAAQLYSQIKKEDMLFYRSADLLTQAYAAKDSGNSDKALELVRQALKIYPYEAESLVLLNQLAEKSDKAKELAAIYRSKVNDIP
ncbi:tetratricopeptide repeat protein [Sphingobacterium wenxiniae]|nr:tetratricopeptide repeat protein [Sphingobacterium wenxiniae]